MHLIAVSSSITVPVENGRSTIALEPGARYVMHDVEVSSGREAGVISDIAALPSRPRRFDAGSGPAGRLILPFIGGMGDAVSMLPVLASIRHQFPDLHIDVSTTSGPAEVFRLTPCVGRVVDYPLTAGDWRKYDHYLTMEAVHDRGAAPGAPLPEIFAAAFGLELTRRSFELVLPRAVEAAGAAPSAVPLAAVAVGEARSLRSYPEHALRDLVGRLVEQGLGCVLLGHADPAWNVPVCPPVITDMRSRTPTVLELAVWLRASDVVICHDSFVMHLAGALGRPTVALFAPTAAAHAAPYDMDALASAAECAPCHETGANCPRGYGRCTAWDDGAVSPAAVTAAVLRKLGRELPEQGGAVAAAL